MIEGVNVCGFIDGEFGLGEAVRSTVRALESQGIPTAVNNLNAQLTHRRDDKSITVTGNDNPYPINIIQVNGNWLPEFKSQFRDDYLKGKYNIAYWAWEQSEPPDSWRAALADFDELWVLSSFCVEAFAAISHVPVLKMPLSVLAKPTGVSREQLGLRKNAFLFVFAFDFVSTFERKNPIAVVEAFKNAFVDQKDVHLFIKSINGWMLKDEMQRLKDAIGGTSNISFVDRVWDRNEMNGLIENCDCYVSLHRSEGFGFTMAEAMSYGKPVIATDYSANTEFMDANNSLPVRYELVELDRDIGPYKAGSQWAEPDIGHAAEQMIFAVNSRPEMEQLAERARIHASVRFSPETVGQRMKMRLECISEFKNASTGKTDNGHSNDFRQNLRAEQQIQELEYLKSQVEWMKASRFWKARDWWWKQKTRFRNR